VSDKTLGQIAEQTWIDLGEQGESDPDKLWQAAAEAVQAFLISNYRDQVAIADRAATEGTKDPELRASARQLIIEHLMTLITEPKERAVIEAAKKWARKNGLGLTQHEETTVDLERAVEVLELAEKGK
jgi:hypothetical protein